MVDRENLASEEDSIETSFCHGLVSGVYYWFPPVKADQIDISMSMSVHPLADPSDPLPVSMFLVDTGAADVSSSANWLMRLITFPAQLE